MFEGTAEAKRRQDERANTTAQKEDENRVRYMRLCADIRELLGKRGIPLHAGASGSDMIAVLHQISGSHEASDSAEHFSASWSDEYIRLAQGVGTITHTRLDQNTDLHTIRRTLSDWISSIGQN